MFRRHLQRTRVIWRALLVSVLLALALPASAFHFPWDQGHDTTASNDPPAPGPDPRPPCDPCNEGATASPVYAALGHAVWQEGDVVLQGRPYIGVSRAYNSNDPVVGLFGNGWSADFDIALYPATSSGVQMRIFKAANGKRFNFVRQADGSYTAPSSRFETITEGLTTVTMTTPDGRRYVFALDGRLLERVETSGKRATFGYDTALRLIRIDDGNGRSLVLAYNGASLVGSVTDHSGRNWRYAYDAAGNMTSVTDPAGGRRTYKWQAYRPPGDANIYYQLLSVTDASGAASVSFTYSGNQVSSYTQGANRYPYTRPASNTSLAGTVTRTDSIGARTTFTYGALGLITQEVDGIGGTTRYAYDSNGRLTQTTDALGRIWTSTYDSLGRMTSSSNPLGQLVSMEFAGDNPRPSLIRSATGRVVTMAYDASGKMISSTDSAGAVTRIAYNAAGDPITATNALGQQATGQYSPSGLPVRMVDAMGRPYNMAYDALGRLATVTNPANEATQFTYDSLDRVVTIVDALGQTTAMTYDAAGRVRTVTDPKGSVTEHQYDSFGRRILDIAPDGRRTTYTYRVDNLLDRVTRPDNTFISYGYDANKRRTQEVAGNETIQYIYDGLNQLRSATGPGGTVSYTYDNAGRMITATRGGRTQPSIYNAEGERIRLDALGQTQTYSRDARGLVNRISGPAGNFDFSFDTLGRRSKLTYPNGSTVDYGFDTAGQLTSLAHNGIFKAPYAHAFDAAGRITQVTGDGPAWNYSYDRLGRLVGAMQGSTSFNYTLDPVGNILNGGRTYDVNHRLTGDPSKLYSYDGRGNLTLEQDRVSGARVAYSWNVKNQLLQVDSFANATSTTTTRRLQYTYDPVGRRASKTDAGVIQRFVYDGNDMIGVLDNAGTLVTSYLFSGAIDEPLSASSGGATGFMFSNYLGSVVAVAGAASVTNTYQYGPYGEALPSSSADSVPFRFTGREKDTDTLYYYRARYYHTGMARFISDDPTGMSGGVNPYSYVSGNPVSSGDPPGTQPGSPDWCRRQLERIQNIQDKINERIGELDENPQGLPEACPGDDLKPSLSRRGHRKLINMDKANLAAQKALYAAYCGGGPPPIPVPVPVPVPAPTPNNNSPFSLEYWEALTGLTGAALLTYIVISEGSRLFPPRNLVPIP